MNLSKNISLHRISDINSLIFKEVCEVYIFNNICTFFFDNNIDLYFFNNLKFL